MSSYPLEFVLVSSVISWVLVAIEHHRSSVGRDHRVPDLRLIESCAQAAGNTDFTCGYNTFFITQALIQARSAKERPMMRRERGSCVLSIRVREAPFSLEMKDTNLDYEEF